MTTEQLRWAVIGAVLVTAVIVVFNLVRDGAWVDVWTVLVGAAGFVLTWEMTRRKD